MTLFRDHEVEVLRQLVVPHFGAAFVETLLREAELVGCEYSGWGFFLTVKHPSLPSERVVLDAPVLHDRAGSFCLTGTAGEFLSGFIVSLGNGELMLEYFPFNDCALPADFRDRAVLIAIEPCHSGE